MDLVQGTTCKPGEQQHTTSGDPLACLRLVAFPPMPGSRLSSTPFGGKVEVIMRLAGLKYEAYGGKVTDPKTAPKKKVLNPAASACRYLGYTMSVHWGARVQ